MIRYAICGVKTKKRTNFLILFTLLRRLDSNERPLGYEPNELPTAPLRDVCECKSTTLILKSKLFMYLLYEYFVMVGLSTLYIFVFLFYSINS